MSKASKSPKPRKAQKPPEKPLGDPVSQDVYAVREASKREVGDMADKITRAPKNR